MSQTTTPPRNPQHQSVLMQQIQSLSPEQRELMRSLGWGNQPSLSPEQLALLQSGQPREIMAGMNLDSVHKAMEGLRISTPGASSGRGKWEGSSRGSSAPGTPSRLVSVQSLADVTPSHTVGQIYEDTAAASALPPGFEYGGGSSYAHMRHGSFPTGHSSSAAMRGSSSDWSIHTAVQETAVQSEPTYYQRFSAGTSFVPPGLPQQQQQRASYGFAPGSPSVWPQTTTVPQAQQQQHQQPQHGAHQHSRPRSNPPASYLRASTGSSTSVSVSIGTSTESVAATSHGQPKYLPGAVGAARTIKVSPPGRPKSYPATAPAVVETTAPSVAQPLTTTSATQTPRKVDSGTQTPRRLSPGKQLSGASPRSQVSSKGGSKRSSPRSGGQQSSGSKREQKKPAPVQVISMEDRETDTEVSFAAAVRSAGSEEDLPEGTPSSAAGSGGKGRRRRRIALEQLDFSEQVGKDIPSFLRYLRLHKYSPLIESKVANMQELVRMDDQDLLNLGIEAAGARNRLLKGIDLYCSRLQAEAASAIAQATVPQGIQLPPSPEPSQEAK
eukprot:Clim_evm15s231 gene=Clim_evmTU15s231